MMKNAIISIGQAWRVRTLPVMLALAAAGIGQAGAQQSPSETLKAATKLAEGIRKATGAPAPHAKLPPGDPCTVLPLADVRRVFPGAKAGERSRRLEEYGLTECGWKGADGQVVLAVQESYNHGGTAKEDAQGMAQGITDPLKPQSLKNVRIETFPGLGVEAAAFVETADPKRGILGDGALMELRRGERSLSLGSGELPRRDRAAALKAFEELGRVAAKRLQ